MEAQELIDMMDARARYAIAAPGLLREVIREALVQAYLDGQQIALEDAKKAVDRAFDRAAK